MPRKCDYDEFEFYWKTAKKQSGLFDKIMLFFVEWIFKPVFRAGWMSAISYVAKKL